MSFIKLSVSVLALTALSATVATAQGRTNVQVAGSSTVLPYANIVAEAFGAEFDAFETPVVEGGGSSTGLRRFCEGLGEGTIDIANSSRAIRDSEREACAAAGVTDIIEVRFGYDGIVFASDINGNSFEFEPSDWYLALAAEVPVDGAMVANQNTSWADVRADLADQPINAFIPGTNHGTREVFEENVILQGCEDTGAMEAMMGMGMDEDAAEEACMTLRTDGASVDIEGDYTQTLANLDSTPTGIGVFGLSFYENNTDRLQVATMSGITPSTETVASGEYPVSRPLFFYIKAQHIGVIPGLKEYAAFFVSDDIAGDDGPLSEYGLVPDPELGGTQELIDAEQTM